TEADGSKAYLVQALDSKELITVVDADHANRPAAAAGQAVSMRIFHWLGNTPPPGTPLAPGNAPAFPQAEKAPLVQAPAALLARPRVVPVAPPVKPSGGPRVWPPAYASRPASDANASSSKIVTVAAAPPSASGAPMPAANSLPSFDESPRPLPAAPAPPS